MLAWENQALQIMVQVAVKIKNYIQLLLYIASCLNYLLFAGVGTTFPSALSQPKLLEERIGQVVQGLDISWEDSR